MAIKFDELLEALDPSLDKFEEDLDNMWIIIPTERRYDDLTADDYFKFAKKYGTFNNQKDCFDKIEELAPDRWDAFIPMKLEGINESLNESMTKAELQTKKYIISYLNRDYPKVASSLNDFDFKLTEDPDTTGYIDLNTKHVVLNRNLSMDDAIRCILDPLREKEFKQALKDPEFIQQMRAENKEIEKLLREKDESLNESKLNEILSESKFKDPIRFKISIIEGPVLKQESDKYALTPSYIKKAMSGRFNDLTNIFIKPEVLIDNQDGTGEICFPGREDLIDIIRDYFSKKYKYHEIEIL